MSTVSVVATVEADNLPPRVRLDVTDAGAPENFAVTVTRLDPDGRTVPVRTTDGSPLVLATSGLTRVGLVYDYEMPYGAPVSYSTIEDPSSGSGEVTVPEGRVWLVHPGVPELSMPIEAAIGSLEEEQWEVRQGVFWPMGREDPIVQTDGRRKSPSTFVTVATDTINDLRKLQDLVRDASVLLLNIPPALNLGFDTCYISVGTISNRRISTIGSDPHRAVQLPFQVVGRPSGGSQAERTYIDVLADFPTYADLMTTYSDYLALLSGP